MDLRRVAESTAGFPPVVFFFQGTVADGTAFFQGHWPQARAVADSPLTFYRGFGIERGGLGDMFGPEVWACGLRAARKGHFIGRPIGDPWVMPGAFLVSTSGAVRKAHNFAHAGDHPDWIAFAT